jgi:hypothetical protein
MDADDARDPTRGTARRRKQDHAFVEGRMVQLETAPLARLHGAKHIGIGQRLNDLIGHGALPLGLRGPGTDLGQQGGDAVEELFRAHGADRCFPESQRAHSITTVPTLSPRSTASCAAAA